MSRLAYDHDHQLSRYCVVNPPAAHTLASNRFSMLAAMQKTCLPSLAMRVGVPALPCRAPRCQRTVVRSQINTDKPVQVCLPQTSARSGCP